MAKIELDIIEQREDQAAQEQYQARPFLPRKPIPNIGLERIGGERFYTKEFMDLEWEKIWTKTWQIGVRESDLPDPGSFVTHEFGKENFLFVRGSDGVVRGFFNVCQHRGNRLCTIEYGDLDVFTCPFHGWQWSSNGSLKQVADPQFFRQFDDGIPSDELSLSGLKTAIWGGWVWFNMNPEAVDLEKWLGTLGSHLETYEFSEFQLVDYQTFEWGGNWKHAVDAFNESYHFTSLHPDMVQFGEGHDIPIELEGIHSRMLNFGGTVSEVLEEQDEMTTLRTRMMENRLGLTKDEYKGSAKDVHHEVLKHKRSIQGGTHFPYEKMNDEQLAHQYHYTFFPAATFTQKPEAGNVFRYRPHATDPNRCYYDFFILLRNPEGTPVPAYEHRVHPHGDATIYAKALEGSFDPILANVLQQDGSNMESMQDGVKSDSFKGMLLCEQEVRLRHFHQTIDRFIDGAYSTDWNAVNLAPTSGLIQD
jgi:phenylpropionate dioxygenase-like ring-hydroxylating dioxygenase large terminal subunit|tara:strand:+ start:4486 stop:5913 length:1428 start_codon:yes stop_codon:yes gene_type:complete